MAHPQRLIFGVFTIVLFSLTAQAQQPGKGQQCPNAWKITPANPKLAESSDAWTSAGSDQDGVLSLSYCWVFQAGLTTVRKLPGEKLKQLPDEFADHQRYATLRGESVRTENLPIGLTIYNGLAFELKTMAAIDGSSITVRLPSVKSEEEFKKLSLLYLDEDWIVPGLLQWQHLPEYLGEQKADFGTRTITVGFEYSTIFHHATGLGRVLVVSFNQSEYEKSTWVDIGISSVVGPPYVKLGETFSYSVTVVNWSSNGAEATDVVLQSSIANARFVSVTATQGSCRKSVNSDDKIVCEFGSLKFAKTAVVSVTVSSEDSSMPIQVWGESVLLTSNLVRSRERDITPENNSYESRGTIIRK